jgi:acetylglutamate kinase
MLKIIKIGGNIVDNPAKLRAFLVDFATLDGDKILVHGGGKVATAISAALGIETTMIDGRRVTDARTLEVVTMVYNGINKQIVSALQGLGCNAVGLCGADGRLIVSRRRAPRPVDYGFVGDPVAVNTAFARQLVAAGHTLVVAPITFDDDNDRGDGNRLLNTNADTVAQTIAVAMSSLSNDNDGACDVGKSDAPQCNTQNNGLVELVYCFEKQGVMLDVDDDSSVIPHIDRARFEELKASGAVHSGMLPKLENAFRALEKGVGKVVICAAENIAKPGYGGTTIS